MIEANLSAGTPWAKDSPNLDDVFEVFFTGAARPNKAYGMQGDIGWRPNTDVYETEDEFIVQVDLSGMAREDIHVYLEGDFVLIKGVRSNIATPGKKHFHKMEIQVGPFERHIRIPEGVDPSTATANYDAGFLFVRIRKGRGRRGEPRAVEISS